MVKIRGTVELEAEFMHIEVEHPDPVDAIRAFLQVFDALRAHEQKKESPNP